MGAIKDVFGKEAFEVGLADIQNLIDQKVEENKILEYKAPPILTDHIALSKWVSAFLNAEGGLIILGVCEDDPSKKDNLHARIFPTKIEFVDSQYTKERIEQIIFSNIHSSAKPDIRIFPIRDPNDSLKVVFLIEIPCGDNPPYQAADNRYYRRLNVTKYPLEHYEIADFFGRRRRPHLELSCRVTNPLKRRIPDKDEAQFRDTYHLLISISNTGNASAKYAQVVALFKNIEILKVTDGTNRRIDSLRDGFPTLQWDNLSGVLFARMNAATVIWELDVKLVGKGKYGLITWDAIADDTDAIKGDWLLLGLETGDAHSQPMPYSLPSYEDIFHKPPPDTI